MLLVCAGASFASERVIITGDRMHMQQAGQITTVTGNAKAVSDGRTITADRMIYNRGTEIISAFGSVRVITDRGTVVGDNLVFERNTGRAYMLKDTMRPIADMLDGEITAVYEADKITLYESDGTVVVIMEGDVQGRVFFPELMEVPQVASTRRQRRAETRQVRQELRLQDSDADNVFYGTGAQRDGTH
ncbi:MAG: hypothetical protein FWC85_00475 [Elusimicrobia bacterium]|nr:hypothetical protein [Elusimicrobiota bacterium]